MINVCPDTPAGDHQNYNCSNVSRETGAPGPAKIEVTIPAELPELGSGAARALLHLLVAAHRKLITKNEQSTEDT